MNCCAAFLASVLLLAPSARAQEDVGHREFEVVSIKKNLSGAQWFWGPHRGGRWVATNASLKRLVSLAWKTPLFAISGGPSWVGAEEYDITAKEPSAATTDEDFLRMLRSLLQERFALKFHLETRAMPVYLLVPVKGGLKLAEAVPQPCLTFALKPATSNTSRDEPQTPCEGLNVTSGLMADNKISMAWFTGVLEAVLGRPVVNRTGFLGSFRLHLEFDPLNPAASDGTKPSIFSALQEQLGLKLETGRGAAEVLVIDQAERPTEN